MQMKTKREIIGAVEKIHFPEFQLRNIPAKIDTGADLSVLHCIDMHEVKTWHKWILCFTLVDKKNHTGKELQFSNYERVKIRNSFGQSEKRYKVKTLIKIGSKNIRASFSLTDRSAMKYPVLLGTNLIRGRFLVDVSKKFLYSKPKRK